MDHTDIFPEQDSGVPTHELVDALPVFVSFIDREGRYQIVNRAYEEWLGLPRTDIIGQTISEVFGEEAYAARKSQFEAALRGERVRFEAVATQPDGSRRDIDMEYRPRRTRDGTYDGVLVFGMDITARKQSERALRESEAFKGAILDAALDCIITIRNDSSVLEWNPAAERTFGYRRDAALGRDLTDLIIPPEHRKAHRRGMARYLSTGQGVMLGRRIEVDALRADGSRFPVELAISAIHVDGTLYFTAYLRDITERRRFEAERREAAQRLRATYEHAFVGIGEVDVNGRFLRVNEQLCDITGYDRDELLARTILDITHPDDQAADLQQFDRQMAGDLDAYTVEKRCIHKSGQIVCVEVSASKVDDTAGRPLYGVRVIRDITEQKRTQEADARLAAIVSSSSDAIVSFAADDGRILSWNKSAEALFGYTREEAVGGPVNLLISPEHLTELENQTGVFSRAMGEGQVQGEVIRRCKDGSLVHVSVSAARMVDHNGRVLGVSAIFRDITERKRWEERQQLLIHELNHRVKNTLATVQSITTQTLRRASTRSEAEAAIESRLIALSRAHDVLTRENWQGANLREVVEQAISPFRTHGEDRLGWYGPQVRLSPMMALAIAMALQELATNATKYGALSNMEGKVRISWSVSHASNPPRLRFKWREGGGPSVVPPTRKGFGSRLIERSLAHDLDGIVNIDYRPEGVVCTLDAPIP